MNVVVGFFLWVTIWVAGEAMSWGEARLGIWAENGVGEVMASRGASRPSRLLQ